MYSPHCQPQLGSGSQLSLNEIQICRGSREAGLDSSQQVMDTLTFVPLPSCLRDDDSRDHLSRLTRRCHLETLHFV